MIVRLARTKDFPLLLMMFVALQDYVKEVFPEANITSDRDKLIGGAALAISVFQQPGHVLYVAETDDKVEGFCAGKVTDLPAFCKYDRIGELNYLYPLKPDVAIPLKVAFDKWALEQGATARWGFTAPSHNLSQRVMERDGMHLDVVQYLKPYQEREA